MTSIDSLADRAMLVSLHISEWRARRSDQKINDEVAANHKVSRGLGNYTKSLMPNCPAFDMIHTRGRDMIQAFRMYTLPWGENNGTRVLLAAGYMQFSKIMKEKKESYEKAVADFLVVYPEQRERARVQLNGLYNPEDYPSETKIASLFSSKVVTMPMPVAGDFRVELSKDALSLIKKDIESSVREACAVAQQDAWERLSGALNAMCERLSDPKAKFKNSLFDNLTEIVDVFPSLNLMQDPSVDAVVSKIKAQILTYKPDDCRKDETNRNEAAQRVADILAMMPKEN